MEKENILKWEQGKTVKKDEKLKYKQAAAARHHQPPAVLLLVRNSLRHKLFPFILLQQNINQLTPFLFYIAVMQCILQ